MNLIEDFNEKVKEKVSDVLSDTSHEGEMKRGGFRYTYQILFWR